MSLSTEDLAAVRTEANAFLPDTAEIQRRTVVDDGAGGRTETWSTVATVRVRLAPGGGGREGSTGSRVVAEAPYVARLPQGTDVREVDRLVISGVTYQVIAVEGRSWEIYKTAALELAR